MMLRKSACFLICFFLSVLGAFAVSGDLGAPFDIVFTKTGVTDYEFYDPATGIVSNSFTFIENANGDAEESFGIKCRIYNSSTFKDLTVLFTDNYSNSHMLRHMDADDFYNYTITAKEKATCTPYMQSILTFIEEGAKIAPNLPIATKRRLYTGEIGFNESNNGFGFVAKVGNATAFDPFTYFYKQPEKTVDDAFADMKSTITDILTRAGAVK